jgi:ParB family chromosome partitioning protein
MANAIQVIAERFESQEEAAQHFGRAPTWLNQATAAANLSEKVTALLDSGKISSTGAAVQLEKLTKKDEAKAETLIEQLPEGEKISKKVVDTALSAANGGRKKKESTVPDAAPTPSMSVESSDTSTRPWEESPAPTPSTRTRVNPGKVKRVAEILGLIDGDEEEILVRLIDEFLALKSAE